MVFDQCIQHFGALFDIKIAVIATKEHTQPDSPHMLQWALLELLKTFMIAYIEPTPLSLAITPLNIASHGYKFKW